MHEQPSGPSTQGGAPVQQLSGPSMQVGDPVKQPSGLSMQGGAPRPSGPSTQGGAPVQQQQQQPSGPESAPVQQQQQQQQQQPSGLPAARSGALVEQQQWQQPMSGAAVQQQLSGPPMRPPVQRQKSSLDLLASGRRAMKAADADAPKTAVTIPKEPIPVMTDLVRQMQKLAQVHGLPIAEVIASMYQHHAEDGGDASSSGSRPDKSGLNMLIPFEAETQLTDSQGTVSVYDSLPHDDAFGSGAAAPGWRKDRGVEC